MFGRKKGSKLTEAEKAERDERRSKFQQTRDKFKLGPHHKMERFGVISLIFFLSFSIVLGGSFHAYREKTKTNLDGSVIYTDTFESSLTGISGKVAGVYGNKDGTKVYILLQLDDADDVTLNVNDYKVFISAFKDHLDKEPKGVFHVLGSTGYLGIELISNSGFDSQVMDVWVRIGRDISGSTVEESDLHKLDKSFTDNDQIRILINPGAKAVKYNSVFDNDKATIADIYKALVATQQEDDIKARLQQTSNDLQVQFNTIEEYRRRLQSLHVRIPKLPKMISGDSFELLKNEDGSESKDYDFKAATIYPGGMMLDWRNMSLMKDGYFKTIQPPVTDKESYYMSLTGESYDEADRAAMAEAGTSQDSEWQWAYDNGAAISEDSGITRDQEALDDITAYEDAISQYMTLKQQYQRDLHWELLLLEINSDNVDLNSQVNADNENNIVVWQQVR